MFYRMNTRELENRINEIDNRCSKRIEDLRESTSRDYVPKLYYEGKHDIMTEKITRFERVLSDAYSTMSDFTAHKGRVAMLEGEIDKLGKQIELVDAKSENRHDKVMTALESGLTKIQSQLDSRGGKTLTGAVSIVSIVSMATSVTLFIIQHFHP